MRARPGDHLRIHRGTHHHDAIYLGGGQVIHYWAPTIGKATASVRVDTLATVCGRNGSVSVWQYAICYDDAEVIRRAYSRLGECSYSLLRENCEHFATWCKTGRKSSSQVERGLVAVGGGIATRATASVALSTVGLLGLQGVSGPGIMSGLVGLGGSAVGGIGIVAAAPAAVATIATHNALRDDPYLPDRERQARRDGRQASTVAAVVGTGGAVALVATAGVPGLSAVGLTTGLTAIGGSMLGGLLAVALIPAAVVAVVGQAVYKRKRSSP